MSSRTTFRATSTASRLGEQHLDVGLAAQDVADRRRDVAGRQPGRRHLVEQRLEEVVVAPVDHDDVHARASQGAAPR